MQRRRPRAGPENGRGGRRALPPASCRGPSRVFRGCCARTALTLCTSGAPNTRPPARCTPRRWPPGSPALVGIQGVMADCAAHLCDGVPEKYRRSCFVQRGIDRIVPGALLDGLQRALTRWPPGRPALLREARFVTGTHAFGQSARGPPGPPRALFCVQRDAAPRLLQRPRLAAAHVRRRPAAADEPGQLSFKKPAHRFAGAARAAAALAGADAGRGRLAPAGQRAAAAPGHRLDVPLPALLQAADPHAGAGGLRALYRPAGRGRHEAGLP